MLVRALTAARLLWVFAAIVSVALTIAAVVIRWRGLLGSRDGRAGWYPLAQAVVVGQALNVLLPLRVGEVARVYIVSTAYGVPIARVLVTVAVEKLADVMSLALATGWLIAAVSLPSWAHGPARGVVFTGVLAAGVAVMLTLRGPSLGRLAPVFVRAVPFSWRSRIERQFVSAADGLKGIRSVRGHLWLWTWSIVVVLLSASTNYLLFLAFDLPLPITAAVLLLAALQFGTAAIPFVPGNVGIFHYVTALVLAFYGVDPVAAAAYAVVLYLVALGPKLLAAGGLLTSGETRFAVRALLARAQSGG